MFTSRISGDGSGPSRLALPRNNFGGAIQPQPSPEDGLKPSQHSQQVSFPRSRISAENTTPHTSRMQIPTSRSVCLLEPNPGEMRPGAVQENRISKNKHRIWELGFSLSHYQGGAYRQLEVIMECICENVLSDELGQLANGSGCANRLGVVQRGRHLGSQGE